MTVRLPFDTDQISPDLWAQDALQRLAELDDDSVDLLYFDPPYGVTQAGWDVPLDLAAMLPEAMRVTHDRSAVIVHAQGMFTADLMQAWRWVPKSDGTPSAKRFWQQNLVWMKPGSPAGFLNANRRPLGAHEDICCFWRKQPTFNPQYRWVDTPLNSRGSRTRTERTDQVYGDFANTNVPEGTEYRRNPNTLLDFPAERFAVHGTQKPVPLAEWIISTWSNPGDLVCDPTMGSGTAAVAAAITGRRFVGGDIDRHWAAVAALRVACETDVEAICHGFDPDHEETRQAIEAGGRKYRP